MRSLRRYIVKLNIAAFRHNITICNIAICNTNAIGLSSMNMKKGKIFFFGYAHAIIFYAKKAYAEMNGDDPNPIEFSYRCFDDRLYYYVDVYEIVLFANGTLHAEQFDIEL